MEKLTDEIIESNSGVNKEDQEVGATEQNPSETDQSDDSVPDVNVEEKPGDDGADQAAERGASDTAEDGDSEDDGEVTDEADSFIALYEESLKGKKIQEGELVQGEIVMVGKEFVLVDIRRADPYQRVPG